jgi:hypothetical protein
MAMLTANFNKIISQNMNNKSDFLTKIECVCAILDLKM